MFPAYGYKHAYPQTRPQMSTECRHHPISEGIPPQMKMEASNPPFIYESWPPHHYGYQVPTQCHPCCNHSNPYPTYYPYRPPYPHFPSPQCYGAYPVYPEPYPSHYAPPHHYTMEMPNYEYDKSMPGNFYCCGCSHPKVVNMNGDKGVKIEEHDPEAENKEDSLVPAGFKNLQKQPIMWVPPEYMKNQERPSGTKPREVNVWPPLDYETIKRILESGDGRKLQDQKNQHLVKSSKGEDVDHKEGPSNANLKSVGQEPKVWSGLMPLDVDNLKKMLLQNENSKKDHEDQSRNQSQQLPFPMIWLPYNNEEKGKARNEREANSTSESSTHKQSEGDDHTEKIIPAVEAEGKEGGNLSVEKSEKPPRIIPVKYMDEIADMKAKSSEDNKKSSEKVTKSKPSSPAKATKLPPICLRVDPLPKKKIGQGKSRSPSPPGEKIKQVDAVKPSSMSENKAKGIENETEKKSTEVLQQKTEVNAIEVEKASKLAGDENEGKDAGEKLKSQEVEVKKKILSGTEAATIIQSAYRGYEVRRWEPLEKMRQIVKIKEEADALKRRIESGASSMDLKQKVALGETIMNLLLKLDTIQGLHSSIRDVRKSVAKELVSLQEMLDTIVLKQPGLDESSQIHDISEAEAKDGETQLQPGDESSRSSGLSTAEDQGAVEMAEKTKGQISSSHELSAEEPCTAPGLSSVEMTHEQAMPEKETEQNEFDVVADEAAIKNLAEMPEAHELSQESEECSSVERAADISMDEESIKSIIQQPSAVGSEVHVDSADQTDMNHDLLAELPVAFPEDSAIQTHVESELEQRTVEEDSEPSVTEPESDEASKGEVLIEQDAESPENVETELEEKTVKEVSESLVTEHEKLEEPDEASKGEVSIEQDAESPEKVETKLEEKTVLEVSESLVTEPEKLQESDEASKGEVSIEQDAESVIPEEFHVPDHNDGEVDANQAEPMKVESHQDLEPPFEVNEQAEVIIKNPIENEAVHEEGVKLEISSTENNVKEDESERRVMEENEKMRSLLEKLIASGKEQQQVICSLKEKLKELEGKLAKDKKKKKKASRTRKARVMMPRSCRTTSNGFSKEGQMSLAS